jgi:hypothetical protein
MAKIERSNRRGEAGSPRRPHFLRMVAIGCAALVLTGGAYQAALGQGVLPDYDEDEGLNTAETVAIAAVAAAGVAALAGGGLFGAILGDDGCPIGQLMPNGDARILPRLPANCTITELCLAPENTKVDSGMCRVYDLRAKCREDKKWYSVTDRNDVTIEVRDIVPNTPVVKLEGSKNTFCVPLGTPQSANGRSVVIRGTWNPGGTTKPMFAEARLQVRAPGRAVPPGAPAEESQPRGNTQPEVGRDR